MRWMWIDRIVELDPGRRIVAIKNVSLAEEHLHDHFASRPGRPAMPVMPGSLIVEGMAQTAGILVGHAGGFAEKVILAKVALARLDLDAFPGQTLRYTATIERLDTHGAATSGLIERIRWERTDTIVEPAGAIDLVFSHLDQNRAGAAFPEHNFVFGDSFRTLIAMSGIGK